eukprot:4451083-Prymnesium_polylepis.1
MAALGAGGRDNSLVALGGGCVRRRDRQQRDTAAGAVLERRRTLATRPTVERHARAAPVRQRRLNLCSARR